MKDKLKKEIRKEFDKEFSDIYGDRRNINNIHGLDGEKIAFERWQDFYTFLDHTIDRVREEEKKKILRIIKSCIIKDTYKDLDIENEWDMKTLMVREGSNQGAEDILKKLKFNSKGGMEDIIF